MRASMIQRIFRRVILTHAQAIVLDAILSKANMFGKRAKVAFECIAGMTGYSIRHVKRIVKSLTVERRILRVYKRVLWPGHNAINVYHVVIPWRADPLYNERKMMGWDKRNNKGPGRPDLKPRQEEKSPLQPAQTFTKMPTGEEASVWFKVGSELWYLAQGLTPPGTGTE